MTTENHPITVSQTPSAEAPAAPSGGDTGRAARLGLWVLLLGFGGFLLWAGLAPLDEGVPTQGMVAIDTKRKTVQHQTGGIVKEVLVGEGQVVKAGQVLLRLDEAAAKAGYQATRQRYLGLRAMQDRLQAELAGPQAPIKFHADLKAEQSDPLISQQMRTQEQLLASRRAALRADLQVLEEAMLGQQGMLQSFETTVPFRQSQLQLLTEELGNTRGLVKEGYAPRNRQLELERMVAESSAANAELAGNITRSRRSIAEMRQRAMLRQQEYRKEVETLLADVTREVESEAGKYLAMRDELDRTDIKAPVSGQIVGLAVQTVGGVISPGQKIMDVVPADEPLLLETRVSPHLIDKVHAGLAADVRFTAFSHSPQLVVPGKVISVSGDLITEPQTNSSYFLARVAITPEGLKELGRHQMQPGMPAEVVIKTGERTLLTYLLHPLTKRMAASMKEE